MVSAVAPTELEGGQGETFGGSGILDGFKEVVKWHPETPVSFVEEPEIFCWRKREMEGLGSLSPSVQTAM